MESLRIARRIVAAYSDTCFLTNLKLNLLVYWCQVETLRQSGEPLFVDAISVGQCGPVEPLVWAEYAKFGSRMIRQRDEWQEAVLDENAEGVIARVLASLGGLTADDLLRMSSARGGAWRNAHEQGDTRITAECIVHSADTHAAVPPRTLARGVGEVTREYPNALRLLERS